MEPAAENNTPASHKRGTNIGGERIVNGYSSIKGQGHDRREDSGFTLVEILIAIVLVGILSAVVVVGIASLTDKGSDSACAASLDAAKAGTVVYFATQSRYPTTMLELTEDVVAPALNPAPAALELPEGGSVDATDMIASPEGDAWTLTMVPPTVALGKPTFTCG